MRNAGMNMPQLKKNNRVSILNCINEQGPISRKDIAQQTGLTPAAVTQLCAALLQEGLLVERGTQPQSAGAGRKKVLVDIDYDSRFLLVMSIGAQHSLLALANLRGRCICKMSFETDRAAPPQAFLETLAQAARQMLAQNAALAPRVAGVVVTLPGAVDKANGLSLQAYGIWDRPVPVCRLLQQALGLPVLLENNVNAFAVAELLYGAGRQYDNLLLIKWGPGVGSAIVIDGSLYEGRHSKAAELGHFIVRRDGPLCRCGRRGCLEALVSYQALSAGIPFAPRDFGQVYRRAAAAGQAAPFDDAIDLFARALVNSMTILAPNRVILFGSLFGDGIIRSRLADACARYDPHYSADRMLYSALAGQEEVIGPAAVFARSLFFG